MTIFFVLETPGDQDFGYDGYIIRAGVWAMRLERGCRLLVHIICNIDF